MKFFCCQEQIDNGILLAESSFKREACEQLVENRKKRVAH